jgi:uncharacterized damage-inducible protein DinB
VNAVIATIAAWGDQDLQADWRLTHQGQTLVTWPRHRVVRDTLFNHWYHHRGQLTVHLRLLDVPLPGIYGPTADEAFEL